MNDTAKIILALALIGVGVWFFKSGSDEVARAQDFPDGTHWICVACKHEFSMPREAVAEWNTAHPDTSVPCPECQENRSVRATKCPLPECGRHFAGSMVEIDGKVCCPICKQPLP